MVVSEYMSAINSIKKTSKILKRRQIVQTFLGTLSENTEIVDNWTTQPKIPEFTETESPGK